MKFQELVEPTSNQVTRLIDESLTILVVKAGEGLDMDPLEVRMLRDRRLVGNEAFVEWKTLKSPWRVLTFKCADVLSLKEIKVRYGEPRNSHTSTGGVEYHFYGRFMFVKKTADATVYVNRLVMIPSGNLINAEPR